MPSPAGPFKVAQEAALRAAAALTVAMQLEAGKARLYTDVPVGAPLPYVVLGDDQIIITKGEGCPDEAEIFSTVSLWSRPAPLDKGVQARAIGSACADALNLALAVAGWEVTLWELPSEQYYPDPDQSTHGVLKFRYQLVALTA